MTIRIIAGDPCRPEPLPASASSAASISAMALLHGMARFDLPHPILARPSAALGGNFLALASTSASRPSLIAVSMRAIDGLQASVVGRWPALRTRTIERAPDSSRSISVASAGSASASSMALATLRNDFASSDSGGTPSVACSAREA